MGGMGMGFGFGLLGPIFNILAFMWVANFFVSLISSIGKGNDDDKGNGPQ